MTRTRSTISAPLAHRTLTMSLSTPGSAAPAGAGVVGAVVGAFAARRRARS